MEGRGGGSRLLRAGRRRRVVIGILVALVALIVAEVALLAGRDPGPSAPQPSLDVARDFAVAATSFDFRRIDRDVERVLSFGDEGFASEFRAAMGDDFTQQVVEARRVSTGTVSDGPTVQSVGDGRAVTLVLVDQQVTSLSEDGTAGPAESVRVALLVTVTTGDDPHVTAVQVL